MSGSGGTFVARLRPVVESGDVDGALRLLRGLEGEHLREARQWFDGSADWWRDAGTGSAWEVYARTRWILALCAVWLCGPRTAAQRVPWASLWNHDAEPAADAALLDRLGSQSSAWAAEFVDAASHLQLRDRGGGNLARVVRRTVVRHGLPCPTGATFLVEWAADTPVALRQTTDDLVSWLEVDPLMPELLHGLLATGECGRWPMLGEVAAALVGSGHLDRSGLVEVALEQLTTSQRPKSQQVLAEILKALDLRAEEVPGGLGHLLGILSTAHRSVQPALLPLALELAASDDDWREVVDLVAGRPDKRAKQVVLAALKANGGARIGRETVAGLLDALVTGEDAAFDAAVAKVGAGLGLEATVEQAATVLGLWSSPPTPVGTARLRQFRDGREPSWSVALDSQEPETDDVRLWLVEQALVEMADGSFDGSEILAGAEQQLGRQQFRSSAFVTAFEDLFLAGGLGQGWGTAVAVADLAAGAAKPPSGLAAVVRMLARYAPEVRGPRRLPSHLAALATDTSRTKAAMEARALAAALGVAGDLDADPPTDESPERRGLWRPSEPSGLVLPEDMGIDADPIAARAETLVGLRELLSENFNGYAESFADVSWMPDGYGEPEGTTGLTEPDRVLAATVAAAGRHGASAVRKALQGIERRYAPLHVVAAVDAWSDGGLDRSTFWRLATEPVISINDLYRRWREEGLPHEEVRARVDALPRFADRLRSPVDPEHGALVVPRELGSPLARFMFLRATEALIRAEDESVVLSTPTWRDGTLEVADLISRLEHVARESGVVGPLDLVQALHRLRDVDVGRVDDVPGRLRSDPRFTHPDGTSEWDATGLVQRWLGLGGLPGLESRVVDGRWHGAPTAPVPFTSLHAWPAELADDPWCPGPMPDSLRLHPRWADRSFEEAYDRQMAFNPHSLPSLAGGRLGVPFHDRLLSLLCTEYNQTRFHGSSTLVMLADAGRLDPAAAGATARGRHEAGSLSLSLLVKSFQRELDDALPGLWPTAIAIADALCAVAKRPPQLADLLRLLTSYAHEVPAASAGVPPSVRALAQSKGSSKAHEAARDLVAALDRAGAA